MSKSKPTTKSGLSWLMLGGISAFSSVGGYLFWRGYRFMRGVLAQPKLQTPAPPNSAPQTALREQAMHIVVGNLEAGIEQRLLLNGERKWVLCAGVRNFREPWARDFSFASFGLMALGRATVVKEGLETFLLHQRSNGQFPVKIHSTNVVERYFYSFFKREQPIEKPIRPKYITAHNTISLDGNALLIIALLNYGLQANDPDFVRTHWDALVRAVGWLQTFAGDDGLLNQGAFTDWADSVARTGKILYTNVLYWQALHLLGLWATEYEQPSAVIDFVDRASAVQAAINHHFWREDLGYYVTSRFFENLSSSGNLLAIAWGMTTPAQTTAILDTMDRFEMANPVPTRVVHLAYPDKFIAIENRVGGIGHYHTYASWLWLGAWHVIALARSGRQAAAQNTFDKIARVIVRDGAVHEVYDPEGHYLSTFWYTSEAPLTWSAGMVAYARAVCQETGAIT